MSTRDPLKTVQYRYDLDGLRGVAIAFVVIFHVFVGRVSGGVDVFLLLSGYFFLGSQLRYADKVNPSLNPWWPLWRTMRRLVPALVVVLGAVMAAVTWLVPLQMKQGDLIRQLTASLLYYQNWELASQNADYNVASDTVSPLQHLWSMSVQGQFYVVAIALALGLRALIQLFRLRRVKVRTIAGPILIAVTVASFAYAAYVHVGNQPLNYYSTFSRMWELTLGAVLALYAHKIQLNSTLRSVFSGIGLVMVLTTGLLFDGAAVFPGPATLYPLGGAVLIILGSGPVAQALSSSPMRWLGRIAYSLYLWHWPLLILSVVYFGLTEPNLAVGLGVIAVSVLLAHVTYTVVENPLRQHRRRPMNDEYVAWNAFTAMRTRLSAQLRAVGGASIFTLFVVLLSIAPAHTQRVEEAERVALDPAVYPGARAQFGASVPAGIEPKPDAELVGDIYPIMGYHRCMAFAHQPPAYFPTEATYPADNDRPCAYGDLDNPTRRIYLVGGSHAEQFSSVLDELGQEEGWLIIPQLRQGCPLTMKYSWEYDESDLCARYNHKSLDLLLEAQPDLVISTSTRPWSFTGEGPDVVPDDYVRVWDILADAGIPFLGFRDNPWGWNPDGSPFNRTQCVAAGGSTTECGIDRDLVYADEDPAAEILASYPNMRSVDTADWYCTEDFCPPVIGNVFVYRDHNHLSTAYVDSLKERIRAHIKSMLDDVSRSDTSRTASTPTTTYFTEEDARED